MSDVMRKQYRRLAPGEKAAMEEIKEAGERFLAVLNGLEAFMHQRHHSIASEKIEEAVMWAVKGVTG